MGNKTMLLLNCLVLLQLGYVYSQARTAWQATGGGGMGMTTQPQDPTDMQIHMTIAEINAAPNEVAAANAAAALYNPMLDTPDAVKTALENKVRVFRASTYNPNWTPGMPLPRLPGNFDVNDMIMGAYYGTITQSPLANAPRPLIGPQPGPRTAIRRGPSPMQRRTGNFRRGVSGWSQQSNNWSRSGNRWSQNAWPQAASSNQPWGVRAGSNPAPTSYSGPPPDFTPLASSNPNWIGLDPTYMPNTQFGW